METVLQNWGQLPDPTTYHKEYLDFKTWFTNHFPPKGFVRSEVARIEKNSSTASSVKQPIKAVVRPASTGLTLDAYKPRLAQEQQAAIAAAQAAKASTGFPPKK